MSVITKRATVYLDPRLHKALRIKSIETAHSMSKLVNEAVALVLAEDAADLAAFEERAHEPLITFADALKDLKRHGRI
ncbi:MAG: CopG family transcriptional regulator [Lentisphaerae bacterium]|nr:CopG family transcriptional regulator [Lentisphaerota bacterium]